MKATCDILSTSNRNFRRSAVENLEVIRAEAEWQRAGAYSVRVQGMNRQHHISLREEFDNHDGDGAKYIVLLENGYPVATCRFYAVNADCAVLGRVVVLPEYREKKLGSRTVREAERWMKEYGFKKVEIDSRIVAVRFYEKLGYQPVSDSIIRSGPFDCVRMSKFLK